ncbi:hypothetical protein BRADO6183 [Bradyrhizobium sp. ORS 278]|nr:hypothetical protein BRADO6183 [Bradyrhizobium sp. ORS 278]
MNLPWIAAVWADILISAPKGVKSASAFGAAVDATLRAVDGPAASCGRCGFASFGASTVTLGIEVAGAICDAAGPHSNTAANPATAEGTTTLNDFLMTTSFPGRPQPPLAYTTPNYLSRIREQGYGSAAKNHGPPTCDGRRTWTDDDAWLVWP